MNKPHYTQAASTDLEEILTFIMRDKPGAAFAWIEKIEAKCLLIAQSPEMGELKPELGADVRTNILGRYVIFHRHTEGRVEILRVLIGDRNITEL